MNFLEELRAEKALRDQQKLEQEKAYEDRSSEFDKRIDFYNNYDEESSGILGGVSDALLQVTAGGQNLIQGLSYVTSLPAQAISKHNAAVGNERSLIDDIADSQVNFTKLFGDGAKNTRKYYTKHQKDANKLESQTQKFLVKLAKEDSDKYDSDWANTASDILIEAKASIKSLTSNPKALTGMAFESIPSLFGAKAAGYVKQIFSKNPQTAGEALVAISVLSGGTAGAQVEDQIRNLSLEDLRKIDMYNESIANGESHKDVVKKMSLYGSSLSASIAASASALIGGVTKVGSVERLGGLGRDVSLPKNILKSTTRETAEETFQNPAETFAGNVGNKYFGKDEGLSKGVGKAAGSGLVLGGILGTTTGTASGISDRTGERGRLRSALKKADRENSPNSPNFSNFSNLSKLNPILDKIITKISSKIPLTKRSSDIATVANEISEDINESESNTSTKAPNDIINPNSDEYSSEISVHAFMSNKVLSSIESSSNKSIVEKAYKDINTHLHNLKNEIGFVHSHISDIANSKNKKATLRRKAKRLSSLYSLAVSAVKGTEGKQKSKELIDRVREQGNTSVSELKADIPYLGSIEDNLTLDESKSLNEIEISGDSDGIFKSYTNSVVQFKEDRQQLLQELDSNPKIQNIYTRNKAGVSLKSLSDAFHNAIRQGDSDILESSYNDVVTAIATTKEDSQQLSPVQRKFLQSTQQKIVASYAVVKSQVAPVVDESFSQQLPETTADNQSSTTVAGRGLGGSPPRANPNTRSISDSNNISSPRANPDSSKLVKTSSVPNPSVALPNSRRARVYNPTSILKKISQITETSRNEVKYTSKDKKEIFKQLMEISRDSFKGHVNSNRIESEPRKKLIKKFNSTVKSGKLSDLSEFLEEFSSSIVNSTKKAIKNKEARQDSSIRKASKAFNDSFNANGIGSSLIIGNLKKAKRGLTSFMRDNPNLTDSGIVDLSQRVSNIVTSDKISESADADVNSILTRAGLRPSFRLNKFDIISNSLLSSNPNMLQEVISPTGQYSREVIEAVSDMKNSFLDSFGEIFHKLYDREAQHPKELEEDPLLYLVNDGKFDNRFVEELALSTLSYLSNIQGNFNPRTPFDIARFLNKSADMLSEGDIAAYTTGFPRSYILQELGDSIHSSLRLKEIKDVRGSEIEFEETKLSIAIHAYQTLLEMDLLVEDNRKFFPEPNKSGVNSIFVEVPKTNKKLNGKIVSTELSEDYQTAIRSYESAGFVLDQITGKGLVTSSLPTLSPTVPDLGPTKTAELTEQQIAMLEKEHKMPWKVSEGTSSIFFNSFTRDQKLQLSGYTKDINSVPIQDRLGVVSGKNPSIVRALNSLELVYSSSKDSDIYYSSKISSVGRTNYVGISPQSSKIARGLIQPSSFKHTVTVSENPEQHTTFVYAVAQNLGIDIDNLTISEVIQELFSPEFAPIISAVHEIHKIQEGKKANTQFIVDALLDKGLQVEGLHSLVNLSRALESGTTRFKDSYLSDTYLASDGKTSGSAYIAGLFPSFTYLGEDELSHIRSVNIIPKGQENISTPDLYQKLAKSFKYELGKHVRSDGRYLSSYHHLKELTGLFDVETKIVTELDRSLSKDPILTTVYGSHVYTVMNKVIEKTTKLILSNYQKNPRELYHNMVGLGVEFTEQQISTLREGNFKEFNLTKMQNTKLSVVITSLYAEPFVQALGQEIEYFNKTKQILLLAYQHQQSVYEKKFKSLIRSKAKEIGVKTSDLTRSEVAEVIKEGKVFESSVGTVNGKTPFQKLSLSSRKIKYNTRPDKRTKNKVVVKTAQLSKGALKKRRSISVDIGQFVFSEIGYKPLPYVVQSTESAVQTHMQTKYDGINVYDALLLPVHTAKDAIQEYNKTFYETIKNHDALGDMVRDFGNESGNQGKSYMNVLKRAKTQLYELLDEGATIRQYESPISEYVVGNKDDKSNSDSDGENSLGTIEGYDNEIRDNLQYKDIDYNNSASFLDEMIKDSSNINKDYANHLRKVMDTIITPNINQVKLTLDETSDKTWGKYFPDTHRVHLAQSKTDVTGMSPAEVYVHEMLHAVSYFVISDSPNSLRKREALKSIYDIREAVLASTSYTDLLPNNPTQSDVIKAKRKYDYALFGTTFTAKNKDAISSKIPTQLKVNTGIFEFIAHGLTNEDILGLVSKPEVKDYLNKKISPKSPELKGQSVVSRFLESIVNLIKGFFNRITNILGNKPNTPKASQPTLDRLHEYVKVLADIDSHHKIESINKLNKINATIGKSAHKFVVKPLVDLLASNRVKNSRSGIVSKIGRITDNLRNSRFIDVITVMEEVRDRAKKNNDGIFNSIIRQGVGVTEKNQDAMNALGASTKHIDQTTFQISQHTISSINQAFTKTLEDIDKERLTKLLLKTGLGSALPVLKDLSSVTEDTLKDLPNIEQYNEELENELHHIRDLFTDPSNIDLAKDTTEAQLKENFPNNYIFYSNYARALAYKRVTGNISVPMLHTNAHMVANLVGTNLSAEGDLLLAEELISKLAAYDALQQMAETKVGGLNSVYQAGRSVILEELNSSEDILDNGIAFVLQLNAHTESESRSKLFRGNPALMQDAYVSEKYDIENDVVFIPAITEDIDSNGNVVVVDNIKLHLDQGYKFLGNNKEPLKSDVPKSSPNYVDMHIMVGNKPRKPDFYKTVISYSDNQSFGTKLDELSRKQNPYTERSRQSLLKEVHAKHSSSIEKFTKELVDSRIKRYFSSPIYSEAGTVANYRFSMTELTKDELFDRNLKIDEVLAKSRDNVVRKFNGAKINEESVDLFYAEYLANYATKPHKFIKLGFESDTEEYRAIYKRLPAETKDYANKVFPQNEIYVSKDLYRLYFGFRKFSLTTMGSEIYNNAKSDLGRTVGEFFHKSLSKNGVRVMEDILLESVGYAKDAILVKLGATMVANYTSNTVLLKSEGVPWRRIVADQVEGYALLKAYQKDMDARDSLQLTLDTNKTMSKYKRSRTQKMLESYNTKLVSSSIHKLIEAGISGSIVEDLEVEGGRKGHIEKFLSKFQGNFNKLPNPIKDTLRAFFMTKDTSVYKEFYELTQVGDIVARYTLHKYNIEKGMDFQKSLNHIKNMFVSYDTPTHRGIQFLNDTGLLLFTKFLFAVPRILYEQSRNNPFNILLLLGLQGLIDVDVPDVFDTYDSGILDSIGNRTGTIIDHIDTISDANLSNVRI